MATSEEIMKAAADNGVSTATNNNIASTTAALKPPSYADQTRIDAINAMYDSQVNSQRNSLESAYNQNLSNLEANRAKIAQEYQTQRNANAVSFERSRRNFNQQAMMNGLNTGAFSQAGLAQNNAYQGSVAQLGAAEANANTDLNKSIADLKVKYQSDVNDAIAKNDYNRAAALLDEYNTAYSQAMTKAQQLAQYGDFSGYSALYGADAARQMTATWQIQNPLIAYNLGQISAGKYKQITGANPPGYTASSGGGGGYYYSGRKRGSGDDKDNKNGGDLSDADIAGLLGGTNTEAAAKIAQMKAEALANTNGAARNAYIESQSSPTSLTTAQINAAKKQNQRSNILQRVASWTGAPGTL